MDLSKNKILNFYSNLDVAIKDGSELQTIRPDDNKFKLVYVIESEEIAIVKCSQGLKWEIPVERVNPYLYSLSSLTEAVEHKGKEIVPIVELLKLKHSRKVSGSKYELITVGDKGYPSAYYTYRANINIQLNPFNIKTWEWWTIQKLIEWNLNVFNLPEGEYIEIM
jgi:hypothetical protein